MMFTAFEQGYEDARNSAPYDESRFSSVKEKNAYAEGFFNGNRARGSK